MFTRLTKILFCTAVAACTITASTSVHAQGVRYYRPTYQNPYYGRGYYPNTQFAPQPYTVQKPVFNGGVNGNTQTIVTQTPQGPVRSSSTVNPYTGEQISTTYWQDPRTGQVTTSQRVVNPRTGQDQASTRTVDPYSGAVQRSNVVDNRRTGTYSERVSGVDPWSGTPYRSGSTFTPYGETYINQSPYGGASRVTIPYGR